MAGHLREKGEESLLLQCHQCLQLQLEATTLSEARSYFVAPLRVPVSPWLLARHLRLEIGRL